MPTIALNASQLPIDGDPRRTVWKVELDQDDLHFILIDGKLTARLLEVPQTEEDFARDDLRDEVIDLREAAELAAPRINGDFWNTNTDRFLGLFTAKV